MSLPHDSQTGLGALRRGLGFAPARHQVGVSAISGLPGLRQRDDPLLPAAVRLLLPAGCRRLTAAAAVGRGVRDGGRPLAVVRGFGVAGAAAIRVVDLRPDAAVHHADQVCGLSGEARGQKVALLMCLSLLSFQESLEAADELR